MHQHIRGSIDRRVYQLGKWLLKSNSFISTECERWYNVTELLGGGDIPGLPYFHGRRHEHSAVLKGQQSMLVFGGYNSLLYSDVTELLLPDCAVFTSEGECLNETLLSLCAWSSGSCGGSTVPLVNPKYLCSKGLLRGLPLYVYSPFQYQFIN